MDFWPCFDEREARKRSLIATGQAEFETAFTPPSDSAIAFDTTHRQNIRFKNAI